MTYDIRDLQNRYNVREHTILAWIHSGELKAINVGTAPGKKKPRWRITEEALREFELLRASQPPAPKRRRKRRQSGSDIIEYY